MDNKIPIKQYELDLILALRTEVRIDYIVSIKELEGVWVVCAISGLTNPILTCRCKGHTQYVTIDKIKVVKTDATSLEIDAIYMSDQVYELFNNEVEKPNLADLEL